MFIPEQSELYPSPDTVPNDSPQRYASEAECIDALGADYCQRIDEVRQDPANAEAGQSSTAIGYDDGDNYLALWPSYYYGYQPFTYWVGRGYSGFSSGVVRGGFGRSGLRYGGGGLS
jgi:hypothetical protein